MPIVIKSASIVDRGMGWRIEIRYSDGVSERHYPDGCKTTFGQLGECIQKVQDWQLFPGRVVA